MTIFLNLYDITFVSNLNFTTEHVKIVKKSRFFSNFCSKFQVFSGFFLPKLSYTGFSRFPGKVTTL